MYLKYSNRKQIFSYIFRKKRKRRKMILRGEWSYCHAIQLQTRSIYWELGCLESSNTNGSNAKQFNSLTCWLSPVLVQLRQISKYDYTEIAADHFCLPSNGNSNTSTEENALVKEQTLPMSYLKSQKDQTYVISLPIFPSISH